LANWDIGYDAAGTALDFTTIQSAIADAGVVDGDTLTLYYSNTDQGLRYNEVIALSKRLSIKSGIDGNIFVDQINIIFQNSGTTTYTGLTYTTRSTYSASTNLSSGSSGTVKYERCVFRNGHIVQALNGADIILDSCCVDGSDGYGYIGNATDSTSTTYRNCSAIGCTERGFRYGLQYGCLSIGNGAEDFQFSSGGDYNCSSDGTAPGSNSITKKFTECGFNDVQVGGFFRTSSESDLVGAGDPSNKATVDIYGRTFATTPTIGCVQGVFLEDDADNVLTTAGGNWTDVAESNVLDGVQWGVGGTSREGTAVGPSLDYDNIHWEEDANLDLQPLESPLDRNYPAEADVEFGVVYGATDDFTGTLVVTGGGPRPTTPTLRIINNQDDTATATISGSDSGTTNTVWIFLRHGGVLELIDAGSRTGDGDVTISNPNGEYIGYVVSELDNILSLPSNPDGFWVTSDRQYLIRTSAAEAELQATRLSQYGHQVTFQNGNTATPITVWATIESGRETIQLRNTTRTDLSDFVFHIPRQTGFPPADFAVGATITYDGKEWEIDIVEPSNGLLSASSSFRCVCGRYRSAGNF